MNFQIYYYLGPGLAIRVICTDEPHIGKDFSETNVLLRLMVSYADSIDKVIMQCHHNLSVISRTHRKEKILPVTVSMSQAGHLSRMYYVDEETPVFNDKFEKLVHRFSSNLVSR